MLQAGGKVIAEKEWSKTVSTKGDASLGLVECECFFFRDGNSLERPMLCVSGNVPLKSWRTRISCFRSDESRVHVTMEPKANA